MTRILLCAAASRGIEKTRQVGTARRDVSADEGEADRGWKRKVTATYEIFIDSLIEPRYATPAGL